jgi:cytochrome c oxidase cbb3-type subunit 3
MTMLEDHEHRRPVHEFDGIVENRVNSPPVYFSVLFYGLILWGVVFAAFYLLSGWSSDGEFQQEMTAHQQQVRDQGGKPAGGAPAAAVKSPEDKEDSTAAGKALYASYCAACHGAEGKGGIGPDLTRSQYTFGRTPEEVTASIAQGRPGGMPAFGNQLSADQVASLTQFVLSLK